MKRILFSFVILTFLFLSACGSKGPDIEMAAEISIKIEQAPHRALIILEEYETNETEFKSLMIEIMKNDRYNEEFIEKKNSLKLDE